MARTVNFALPEINSFYIYRLYLIMISYLAKATFLNDDEMNAFELLLID